MVDSQLNPPSLSSTLTNKTSWFQLDTGWACGGVEVNEKGLIVSGAPIFRKLIGQSMYKMKSYKFTPLKKEDS
jgi:hypothetical protein